jgi:hypothetical protein
MLAQAAYASQKYPMKTKQAPKEKINFTCCNFIALGFRGAHRTEQGIQKYAKCPKCGRRTNLGPL